MQRGALNQMLHSYKSPFLFTPACLDYIFIIIIAGG